MQLSPRPDSLFKEVRVFKVLGSASEKVSEGFSEMLLLWVLQ